jgi:hypothetical protein
MSSDLSDGALRDRIACIVDDIQAGQQVIENVTELIEESKAEVEEKIEAEFAAIFKQLEKREQALLNRAKAISASKLSALVSHAEKLELALAEIDDEGSTGIVVEPRETCEVVCAEDPVFEVDEGVRDKVESFGEIGDTGALKVSAMLEAVVGHPKCTNFLAEVLNLIASMPVDEESGLINEDVRDRQVFGGGKRSKGDQEMEAGLARLLRSDGLRRQRRHQRRRFYPRHH